MFSSTKEYIITQEVLSEFLPVNSDMVKSGRGKIEGVKISYWSLRYNTLSQIFVMWCDGLIEEDDSLFENFFSMGKVTAVCCFRE